MGNQIVSVMAIYCSKCGKPIQIATDSVGENGYWGPPAPGGRIEADVITAVEELTHPRYLSYRVFRSYIVHVDTSGHGKPHCQ